METVGEVVLEWKGVRFVGSRISEECQEVKRGCLCLSCCFRAVEMLGV